MADFQIETKNKVDINKKPRVYFTCHPEDFEKSFRKICDDILETQDCAIYYTESMEQAISAEERELDLSRSNLFVIPVTLKLLNTPNRAMDVDFPYAIEKHIPVLPILMEQGLDKIYGQPDKFGELQYLNPFSTDLTEISYEEKLKKYLDSVLISDAMANRIRAAFDAYIFLSYRKKDRKYANDLMRLIHSNPECRDIAIWFDEFLVPGESFKKGIERILEDCRLFALLITPRLLEKVVDENGQEQDNYVISTELPLARKNKEEKGTNIFAVEMEETDKAALAALDIVDYVSAPSSAFRPHLLAAVSKIAATENDDPEHNFLIGLAYLEGIDVEVDYDRGINLITAAAEAGLYEAMEKLYSLYKGVGTKPNYPEAIKWAERMVSHDEKTYGKEHPTTLHTRNNLAFIYGSAGYYQKAVELLEQVYEKRQTQQNRKHPLALNSLNNLGHLYLELQQYKKAVTCLEEAYKLRREVLGEENRDTLTSLNNLAAAYIKDGQYKNAEEHLEKAYQINCRLYSETAPDTLLVLANKAYVFLAQENWQEALSLYEKIYEVHCNLHQEEQQNALTVRNNIAFLYGKLGFRQKALELYQEVYALRCQCIGEKHPETLITLKSIAISHAHLGKMEESARCLEKVYAQRKETLKKTYPGAETDLNDLVNVFWSLKDYRKAALYQGLLYDLHRDKKGTDHPETLDALHKQAYTCGVAGEYEKAVELFEKTYALFCARWGESHLETLGVLGNLAYFYYMCKNSQTAASLQKKVYDGRCEQRGETWSETINALNNYALYCKEAGDLQKAFTLYKKLCPQLQAAYGENHPSTIKNLQRMEEVRSQLARGDGSGTP